MVRGSLKFKEFAWNGFSINIPEDMRLTVESGNLNSGYLRLERENLSMEVKWGRFDPKKAKPLAEVANSFLKEVKKNIEKETKKKIDLKAETLENRFVSSHNAYSMAIKGGANDLLYMWTCDESERIILLHFTSILPKNEGMEIIERILESFKCHDRKEGFIQWSALNMRFMLPSTFLLSDRRIAVGRTYLLFEERKLSPLAEKGRNLIIEYFSMANLLFGSKCRKLEEWFQENYWKDLKKRYKHISFQKTDFRRLMRHNVLHKRGIKNSGLIWRRTSLCENFTWYCSRSNRIYSISFISYVSKPFFLKRAINEEEDEKILQTFLSSFQCHSKSREKKT